MTPLFADTSYYLALLISDDSAHERAMALSQTLDAPVVTTAWVLAELANSLAAARRREQFQVMYDAMRKDREVAIVPPTMALFEEGVALYTRYRDKDWSLTDCISFIVMREFGVEEALTGDHHFKQAGFRILLR